MYASRTGGETNLAPLRRYGWRLMVSARGVHRTEGFRYCIDNGAWTAHQKGQPFDVTAFEAVLAKLGAGADFVVCPDRVGDARATLHMTEEWLPKLEHLPRVLVAVQDGMVPDDIAAWLGPRVGIFIGGTTLAPPLHGGWKEDTADQWGELARRHGAWCHMGRVNSERRITICGKAGLDSFDGSGPSRYSTRTPYARKYARVASQGALIMDGSVAVAARDRDAQPVPTDDASGSRAGRE